MAGSPANPRRDSEAERERVILSPFQYTIPTTGELAVMRDKAGLTQQQVADELDVDRNTVRKWEHGEWPPSIETVEELLALYRVEIASK